MLIKHNIIIKYDKACPPRRNDRYAMLSSRLRAMYRNLGLNRSDVAKLLHVSLNAA
jgi:hypothetical protein